MPRTATKTKAAPDSAKDAEIAQLRASLQSITEAHTNQSNKLAAMQSAGAPMSPGITMAGLSVGIRNISNNTIGLPDSPVKSDPPVQLHVQHGAAYNPNAVAIISYPHWLVLRKHPMYAKGLYIRDDSVLGPHDNKAPADRETDMAPGAKYNQVPDPRRWIESRKDKAIKRDAALITSEDTIRRLKYESTKRIEEYRAAHKTAEILDSKERRVKAELEAAESLPSIYQYAEHIFEARLLELDPGEQEPVMQHGGIRVSQERRAS